MTSLNTAIFRTRPIMAVLAVAGLVAASVMLGSATPARGATVTVSTIGDLTTEIESAGDDTIRLSADIDAPTARLLSEDAKIFTLDLAGYDLTVDSLVGGGVGSTMTIMDSVGGGVLTAIAANTGPLRAAIGVRNLGTLVIDSGTIVARSERVHANAKAGIGVGTASGHITIVINGGTITATGAPGAAGIGGSRMQVGNVWITINGGNVTATGGTGAAGIGAADEAPSQHPYVTLNGGTIVANGDAGHDIGSGPLYPTEADVTVGGTVDFPNGWSIAQSTDAFTILPAGIVSGAGPISVLTGATLVNNGAITNETVTTSGTGTITNHNYLVSFDSNGTGATPASETVRVYAPTMDAGDRSIPASPTRTDFAFEGWNTVTDGSGAAFSTSTTLTADTTVFGQWEAVVIPTPTPTPTPSPTPSPDPVTLPTDTDSSAPSDSGDDLVATGAVPGVVPFAATLLLVLGGVLAVAGVRKRRTAR